MQIKLFSKKAFELSINFIVILIISIAVFGLGIVFINKIYKQGEKTSEQYFERYEKEVQDLLCDVKDKVCIPRDTQDLSKNKHPFYGVVITNTLGVAGDKFFKLQVEFNKAYRKDNSELCTPSTETTCGNPSGWKQHDTNPFKIENNGAVKKAIALAVKGPQSGTYVFDVKVNECTDGSGCTAPNPYGNLQKIYLYVP